MRILGLDPSQTTGWAVYDTEAHLSAIRAGVIRVSRAEGGYEVKAAELGRQLTRLIKDERPDFIVMEEPLRSMPAGRKPMKFMGEDSEETQSAGGVLAVISSNQMAGACAAIIGAFAIPFATIPSSTWRKQFLGFGRNSGWQRADWKKACRERCKALRIVVTNDDMADAVGVAFAGAGLQQAKMIGRAA